MVVPRPDWRPCSKRGFSPVIKARPAAPLSLIEAAQPPQPLADHAFESATTDALLVQGGDGRLVLDPASGVNKYGCAPRPDPALADFGSSTASVISSQGHAAADALRERLQAEAPKSHSAVYARELERVRGELTSLCGLDASSEVEVVFAASGSDLHLLVRELVGGTPAAPLLCLGVEPQETGSGVPVALEGRHFSDRAALGESVIQGCAIGPGGGSYIAIASRKADGRLREVAVIEAELDALCLHASKTGRRVLLTVADVSKTGLISPDLHTVLALRRRFPNTLEVLIDACQFRLSDATLRAYLDNDLMVAVTGSKFLTGPIFCGALFVPPATAQRLRGRLLRPALRPYSARAEWPKGWFAGKALSDVANNGLLLRWEAALAELRAFRALGEDQVDAFTTRFAEAIQVRLAEDARFEPLAVRPLDRDAIGAPEGWDRTPTIFPFLLREQYRTKNAPFLSVATTDSVYRALMVGGIEEAMRARLGQPVSCGERDGAPISALRICNSARVIVEGVADPEGVINRALAVLDQTAQIAGRVTLAGRIYS